MIISACRNHISAVQAFYFHSINSRMPKKSQPLFAKCYFPIVTPKSSAGRILSLKMEPYVWTSCSLVSGGSFRDSEINLSRFDSFQVKFHPTSPIKLNYPPILPDSSLDLPMCYTSVLSSVRTMTGTKDHGHNLHFGLIIRCRFYDCYTRRIL